MRAIPIGESVPSISYANRIEAPAQATQAEGATDFAKVLKGLARRVDEGERVVNSALENKPQSSDPQGMLALQAGVYRYVESVDLCSKLVDRASSAIKTTLQNQ